MSEVLDRLLSRMEIDEVSGCWNWVLSKVHSGHGVFCHEGKVLKAHRESWKAYKGDIPDGLCVLHKCDNPPCINPDHLFIGSQADNIKDRDIKRRMNHKLSEDSVNEIRLSDDSQYFLARKFDVHQSTISLIKSNKIWSV